MALIQKDFPVFDCDAHVTESPDIWNHLSKAEQETVKPWFYPDGDFISVNGKRALPATWGKTRTTFAANYQGPERRVPNRAEVGGPGVTKKLLRKLSTMELTEEQLNYVEHKGCRDPKARLGDLNQQGIDQVVVIPLMMFGAYLFVENPQAAALIARAYNDWADDWCATDRRRLFPAAVLPLQDPKLAAEELRRVAAKGFKVAMIRPVDIKGAYPNHPSLEPLWQAFADTQVVVAMHSLPRATIPPLNPTGRQNGAGDLLWKVGNPKQLREPTEPQGFIFEAMVWTINMLMSDFFERHPNLSRMAIMESNASWLPMLLERCDRAFPMHRHERTVKLSRRPSEAFMERIFISFEGDESMVYRQHAYFENIGIWASDAYHHDGSDAWSAMREMTECKVPLAVQKKFMGENARRMYRIPPQTFTSIEPESYPRPSWYPKESALEREYAGLARRV